MRRKRCTHAGCDKGAQGGTEFCITHGGGKRCTHAGCDKGAIGATGFCVTHGGGKRCSTGVHLENPPHANFKMSSNASLRVDAVGTVPKPELEGVPCCLECLKRMDPTNIAVKVHIRKEIIVLSAIAQGLASEGKHQGIDLAHTLAAAATHDCTLGPSRRRPDLHIPLARGIHLVFENDENAHQDRTTSCENAKLGGTLIDLGAVGGFTKDESEVMDFPEADLDVLDELDPAARRLLLDRRDAIARVLRDHRHRHVPDHAPKLHVLRFNCDEYTDAVSGKRHAGLFRHTGTSMVTGKKRPRGGVGADEDENATWLEYKPAAGFATAVEMVVARIVELAKLAAGDADWVDAHKTLEVEYMRYF